MPVRSFALFAFAFLALGLPDAALSQAPSAPGSNQPKASAVPPATLRTGITIVPIDVVVTDHAGHPVPGLAATDFHITENNAPQSIRTFEVVNAAAVAAAPHLPPLPPGIFTDYQPAGAAGPLNVLLVDVLNTPLLAQIYLKQQLNEYIRKAPPETRTAIFGLNTGLTMLQGFTADPAVLRAAVERKLTPGRSAILNDATGVRNGSENDSTGLGGDTELALQSRTIASAAELVQQFEAQQQSFQTQVRILDTINAFTALGHYLASFPGRKNLVWFSGSFPINVLGDPSIVSPFQVTQTNGPAFHAMVDQLLQAQVAVYPVDARALETEPTFDAAHTGSPYVGIAGGSLSRDLAAFQASRGDEHATMEALAHESGGKAFFNSNGLVEAMSNAISSGANYYTLAYTPTDLRHDGSFRSVHVDLTGAAAAHGYTLSYRRGYYAPASEKEAHPGTLTNQMAASAQPAAKADATPIPFEATAMGHGAPEPSELLFKVRVLPVSAETQATVAAGNHVNAARAKGPFRTYAVDFAALAQQLQLTPDAQGKATGHVEFVVYVFDHEGNLLVTAGEPLDLNLSPADRANLQREGLKVRLLVSAPAQGESFLRMAVHDLDSRKMGIVEVSTQRVSQLPPLAAAAPPPVAHAH